MKYFILESNTTNPLPQVENWFQTVNPRHLNRTYYENIAGILNLRIQPNPETVFPDILTSPCFMVSAEAARVINLYDKSIPMKRAVLFDVENRKKASYSIPILEEISAAETGPVKETLNESDLAKFSGRHLLKLTGLRKSRIIVSLDLIESLLRREALGIVLKELEFQTAKNM